MAPLTYRILGDGDRAALERLWAGETTWGDLTGERWDRWYVQGPCGPPVAAVAEDEHGELAGHLAFMPLDLEVDGTQTRAWRAFALILARPHRRGALSRPLQHPFLRLYRTGVDELRARGATMVFGMPDSRMLPVLRRLPMWQTGSFPLWSRALPLSDPATSGYEVLPLRSVPAEAIDGLWESARPRCGCTLVKRARLLGWKSGDGEHGGAAVSRGGRLVGLATTREKRAGKHNRRQLDVCDVLAVDDDALHATLTAALGLAEAAGADTPDDDPLAKATLLMTPPLEAVAAGLGFVRDDYDFSLAVHILDGPIPPEHMAPARWLLSMDD